MVVGCVVWVGCVLDSCFFYTANMPEFWYSQSIFISHICNIYSVEVARTTLITYGRFLIEIFNKRHSLDRHKNDKSNYLAQRIVSVLIDIFPSRDDISAKGDKPTATTMHNMVQDFLSTIHLFLSNTRKSSLLFSHQINCSWNRKVCSVWFLTCPFFPPSSDLAQQRYFESKMVKPWWNMGNYWQHSSCLKKRL